VVAVELLAPLLLHKVQAEAEQEALHSFISHRLLQPIPIRLEVEEMEALLVIIMEPLAPQPPSAHHYKQLAE
jgi:hypothetical protein